MWTQNVDNLTQGQQTSLDAGDSVVEVVNVAKRFGTVTALEDINLSVYRGEFLTLLGPSGCGKTTLLRIIAGFETPTTGRVYIAGQDMTPLPPERRPLNMVFQRYALFPHLSVAENIAFGLRLKRLPESDVRDRVANALALVRLQGLEQRMPHQISGGQAQRVALARALINKPEVLLLDEPLSALDRKIRLQMQDELRTIQAEVGTTFLYVTHDQDEAMAMSTRVVLLRAGRMTQVASPQDLYLSPSSRFAAHFIGDANLLEGHVVTAGGEAMVEWCGLLLTGLVAPGRVAGERVSLMVRPEAIHLVDEPIAECAACAEGRVERSAFYGFYWLHRVRVGDQILSVREMDPRAARSPGARVRLTIDTHRVVVLPATERSV
ncbi:MAG TPA: ABC transporter ATP-binding protein [Anaerolineae bacterium]|nr:ABC transporter ATP-binding protein [Anaerolineae bacterium]